MNQFDIKDKIIATANRYGSGNPQQFKQLRFRLSQCDDQNLFQSLYAVFLEGAKNNYEQQQLSGVLLYELNPQVEIDLKPIVRNCLNTYNLSVEELPWYLDGLVGGKILASVIKEVGKEELNERERRSLETFSFWIKIKGEELAAAAFEGSLETVEAYLNRGASIDASGRVWNPLHAAIENEHLAVVDLLIHRGANIEAINGQCTPIAHAVDIAIDGTIQTGGLPGDEPTEIVERLLAAGADPLPGIEVAKMYQSEKMLSLLNVCQHNIGRNNNG